MRIIKMAVILLAVFALGTGVACSNGCEEAYNDGFDAGYSKGLSDGTLSNYSDSREAGYYEGKNFGFYRGYEEGYLDGCRCGAGHGFDAGYDWGYSDCTTDSPYNPVQPWGDSPPSQCLWGDEDCFYYPFPPWDVGDDYPPGGWGY